VKIKSWREYSKLDAVELLLRMWIGFVLIKNSGVGLITPLEELGLPTHIYQILKGMWDTGYMMHLVKATELITGLMMLFNFLVPLALVALIPVVINIYGLHVFMFHSYVTQGLYMILICGFLVYRHWAHFKPLLSSNCRNNVQVR
jgi:putative oxidoreductase